MIEAEESARSTRPLLALFHAEGFLSESANDPYIYILMILLGV